MLHNVLSKFAKDDVNRLQKYKRVSSGAYRGSNKRMSRLVPPPNIAEDEVKMQARHLMQREFLLSLASTERTCCIHFSSLWRKSRASMLVFRGRVLGCIYTRKDLDGAVFGQDAYSMALAELGGMDTEISGYDIDEDVALAAAAIFSSHTVVEEPSTEIRTPYSEYNKFVETKGTGVIFLIDEQNQTVCRVYIVEGEIAGVYSNAEAWLRPDIRIVEAIALSDSKLTCESFLMEDADIQKIYSEGFSVCAEANSLVLLDLSVKKVRKNESLFARFVDNSRRHAVMVVDNEAWLDEHQQMIDQVTAFANRVPAIKHAHSVDPLL